MFFRHPMLVSLSNKLNTYTSYVQPLPDPAEEQRGKKKVLLLRCHPVPESYSTALAAAAERGLRAAGHEVRVRSLYGGKDAYGGGGASFPPLLTTEERRTYNDVSRSIEVATPQVCALGTRLERGRLVALSPHLCDPHTGPGREQDAREGGGGSRAGPALVGTRVRVAAVTLTPRPTSQPPDLSLSLSFSLSRFLACALPHPSPCASPSPTHPLIHPPRCTSVVFVFPTWWYSPPAALKVSLWPAWTPLGGPTSRHPNPLAPVGLPPSLTPLSLGLSLTHPPYPPPAAHLGLV